MLRVILLIICCAVLALGGGMVRSAIGLGLLAFGCLCAWIAWQLVRMVLGRP